MEPEQQGSPLDLPVEPLNLAHIFQIPDVKGVWGATAVMGTFFLVPYQGGATTPPMMIPSGNPKEVLDLPAHPYDTSPRAPE